MLISRFARVCSYVVGLIAFAAQAVFAQDYPSKPIHIITGSPGGGNDFSARLVAQGISGPLGQSVIVENRIPALIMDIVSKSPPDGYTLLVNGSTVWLLPLLRKVNYDAVMDFFPVAAISRDVFVLAVHPSVPAKSLKELIALAKAKPGVLNYASGVPGGPNHLSVELFKAMAGVNIVNVSYKGNPQRITALISGEVELTVVDGGLVAGLAKAGKIRPLAVTSATPSALAPGLPTVAAAGVPGYESVGITGVFAPAKTPRAIINRLNQEIVRLLNLPEVKQKVFEAGSEAIGDTPEQFASTIKSDIVRMGKTIKDAGIKID